MVFKRVNGAKLKIKLPKCKFAQKTVKYLGHVVREGRRKPAEALQKLQRVLNTASEYGLELNVKKCHFLQHEIDFLGLSTSISYLK